MKMNSPHTQKQKSMKKGFVILAILFALASIACVSGVEYSANVIAPQVITYDFSDGAGSDKWAYRYQHNAKPPATNDIPRIKFPPPKYDNIKTEDGTMQEDVTSRRGYYAIHRFKFEIAEEEENITRIHVLWTGKGSRQFGTDGATLYIWNCTTGAYEQLDTNTSKKTVTLVGTIANNVGDYIDDDDGSLIIIAEQNSPQRRLFWRWKFRSYIGTDYVKVDIAC